MAEIEIWHFVSKMNSTKTFPSSWKTAKLSWPKFPKLWQWTDNGVLCSCSNHGRPEFIMCFKNWFGISFKYWWGDGGGEEEKGVYYSPLLFFGKYKVVRYHCVRPSEPERDNGGPRMKDYRSPSPLSSCSVHPCSVLDCVHPCSVLDCTPLQCPRLYTLAVS